MLLCLKDPSSIESPNAIVTLTPFNLVAEIQGGQLNGKQGILAALYMSQWFDTAAGRLINSTQIFVPMDVEVAGGRPVYLQASGNPLVTALLYLSPLASPEPRGSDVNVKASRPLVKGGSVLEDIGKVNLLKKSVVRADRAYLCCKTGRLQVVTAAGRIIQGIYDILDSGKIARGSALALVPNPLLPRVITIPETAISSPALAGIIVLLAASDLAAIATQTAALLVLAGVAAGIGTIVGIKEDPDICFDCVSASLLSQDHPRKRERVKINRRL